MTTPPPRRARADPVHVAWLRGVNVGGRNRLAMSELARMFRDAGCARVVTYIQSGNVVFRASPAIAARVGAVVGRELLRSRGLAVPVVVRPLAELEASLSRDPFAREAIDPAETHVGFLRDRPSRGRLAALDPDRSPGDRFVVLGRDVFLHLPRGVARTRLTSAWFDAALDTVITMRNRRTADAVLALAQRVRDGSLPDPES